MEKRLMKKIVIVLLLGVCGISNVYAAQWAKLQDNKHTTLMLDKQSITEVGKYQKAWVEIDYKTMQTNLEYPEKSYNNAKVLWYFNCAEQKSATAQVYQLLNDEQVYSAAIDVKRALFLEPVPETEADIAMHYVCRQQALEKALKEKKALTEERANNQATNPQKPTQEPAKTVPVKAAAVAPVPTTEKGVASKAEEIDKASEKTDKKANETKEVKQDNEEKQDKKEKQAAKDDEDEAGDEQAEDKKSGKKQRAALWKYTGSKGPEVWGDLSPDYATCKTGRNQSPIDISKTISTTLKPLKTFQRFSALDIVNNGHTIQANFKAGNMMVVDGVMYQMKQVHFHAPSENQIMGKSYPLEAHFEHVGPAGNLAVLAVMFEEGHENKALAKLWEQMPKRKGKPTALRNKVLAGELMPRQKEYYRFSGSLTEPPCSEGVVWIVMKTPMTVSKDQIDAFKKVMKQDNNRPIQPLNGRMVID